MILVFWFVGLESWRELSQSMVRNRYFKIAVSMPVAVPDSIN